MSSIHFKAPRSIWDVTCFRDGKPIWREQAGNLVTKEGQGQLLSVFFKGASYTAGWYAGLKAEGTINVTDTQASHGGWTELNAYSGATRPAVTWATVSNASLTVTTPIIFSITTTASLAGRLLTTGTTIAGNGGILYGVADFTAVRTIFPSDEVRLTLTVVTSTT